MASTAAREGPATRDPRLLDGQITFACWYVGDELRVLPLTGRAAVSIGRRRGAEIRLDDRAEVSGHPELRYAAPGWELCFAPEGPSTPGAAREHGTARFLRPGDHVDFGRCTLWVFEDLPYDEQRPTWALEVLDGPERGDVIALAGRELIGRAGASIALRDGKLSRRHLELFCCGREVLVAHDCLSRNGSRVNGERLERDLERLRSGDVLAVGDTRLRVIRHSSGGLEGKLTAVPAAFHEAARLLLVEGDDSERAPEQPAGGPQGSVGLPNTELVRRRPSSVAPLSALLRLGRRLGRKRSIVLLALLVSTVAGLTLRAELTIPAEVVLRPKNLFLLRAPFSGFVKAVSAGQAGRVLAGACVVRFDDRERVLRRALIRARIRQARIRQQLIAQRSGRDELRVAALQVEEAQLAQNVVTRQAEDLRRKLREGLATADEVARAERAAEDARSAESVHVARLRQLKAGGRHEDRQVIEAEVSKLEAEEKALGDQLAAACVRAPFAGQLVLPPTVDLSGRFVPSGEVIAALHGDGPFEARLQIHERDVEPLSVGQPVKLRIAGVPSKEYLGPLASLATSAGETGSEGKGLTAVAYLEDPERQLRAGLRGHAKVYCGKRRLAELALRRLLGHLRVDLLRW